MIISIIRTDIYFLLWTRYYATLYMYTILTRTLRSKYCLHFPDEETEMQRGKITFPKSHSYKVTVTSYIWAIHELIPDMRMLL